ncbi:unnamed protein product, partial [Rotaria sp. Silwood1]
YGPDSTYDDPIFDGHRVVHTVNFFGSFSIKTSHDFIFVRDHIAAEHHIISSVGDICVCSGNNK